jgi:hypothetical protein
VNAVDPTNPQSWNRYGYALNNPLANVDPSGLLYCPPASPDGSDDPSAPDCVSDDEYSANPGMYQGWLQVTLVQSVTVTATQDYVDYQSSMMGVPFNPGVAVLSMVYAGVGFIAQPACSGGGFLYAGVHESVKAVPGIPVSVHSEFGVVPIQYDSQTGWSSGLLADVGAGPVNTGVEAGWNWTQSKLYIEGLLFAGTPSSAGSSQVNQFSNESAGLGLGVLGGGLLATSNSEYGGYLQAGPFAAGAYFKPSFLGKGSCKHP